MKLLDQPVFPGFEIATRLFLGDPLRQFDERDDILDRSFFEYLDHLGHAVEKTNVLLFVRSRHPTPDGFPLSLLVQQERLDLEEVLFGGYPLCQIT